MDLVSLRSMQGGAKGAAASFGEASKPPPPPETTEMRDAAARVAAQSDWDELGKVEVFGSARNKHNLFGRHRTKKAFP